MTTFLKDEMSFYENTKFALEGVYFDYAMEAEENINVRDNPGEDKGASSSFLLKIRKTVEEMIKRVRGIIERCVLTVSSAIKKVFLSDKGFDKKLNEAMKKNKPMEAIKVISYQYNDQFLDGELQKVTSACVGLLNGVKATPSDLKNPDTTTIDDTREIDKELMSKLHVPSEIGSSLNSYFIYLKKGFHVEKKEILIKASEAQKYQNISMSYKNIEGLINSKTSMMNQQLERVKAVIQRTIDNREVSAELKRRAVKQLRNIGEVFNFYTMFLKMYSQLKIEEIMAARTILKKIYRMS